MGSGRVWGPRGNRAHRLSLGFSLGDYRPQIVFFGKTNGRCTRKLQAYSRIRSFSYLLKFNHIKVEMSASYIHFSEKERILKLFKCFTFHKQ